MTMAQTQPVLAGQNLPYPREYQEKVRWVGGDVVMADGTVKHDLVQTGTKRMFRLTWSIRPESEIDNILTAYGLTGGDPVSFTTPVGGTYTVTRPPGDSGLQIDWRRIGSAFYGSTAMELVEV